MGYPRHFELHFVRPDNGRTFFFAVANLHFHVPVALSELKEGV